jgi:C-terminal processing protease CtpA/Prc
VSAEEASMIADGTHPDLLHHTDVVDRSGNARQYWTSPAAGRLDDTMRISVLISERTFSGCEELAYNLQAQRATIVGRRTCGGAHPVTGVRAGRSARSDRAGG